jgi:hypothetical protein
MSFFGGDHTKAHWSVHLRYKANKDERDSERKVRCKAERATLAEHGFKSQNYFEFKVNDEAAKVAQRAKADAFAAKIEEKSGVKMEVAEGCFL